MYVITRMHWQSTYAKVILYISLYIFLTVVKTSYFMGKVMIVQKMKSNLKRRDYFFLITVSTALKVND